MSSMDSTAPDMEKQDAKEQFYRYFQQAVTDLQEQMTQLEGFSLVGGERQDGIDHCLAGIASLSNDVSDASTNVPAYDLRTYSQAVKALNEQLQETVAKFAPKSKFKFKTSQKNSSAISLSDAAELAAKKRFQPPGIRSEFLSSNESSMATTPANLATPPGETDAVPDLPPFPKNYNEEMSKAPRGSVRKPSFAMAKNISVSNHDGLHIILPSSAARATASGSVTKLNRCIVDMSVPTATDSPFAGLILKDIKRSLVIAGHVAGAVHITDIVDSIVVVATRQFRMHDCKNVDVYLHCASRPIIEDCSDVRFAPIPNHYETTSEEPVLNQWDQIDDFKWLKVEHSPNWAILPEDQRLGEDIWTTAVSGGPGIGLDDVLKTVGIPGR